MKERLIIIVLAVVSGLVITTVVFFIYQNFMNSGNDAVERTSRDQNQQSPTSNLILEIDEPIDGSLTDRRTISVRGTTNPENVVIISSNQEDVSGKPSNDGKFSLTIDIDAGANILVVRSIASDGRELAKELVVTYNTEEF